MYRSFLLLLCLCASVLPELLPHQLGSASPFLYVSAASQYPGLPIGFNTVLRCCNAHSMLPRDKLIFTQGSLVFEYDAISQETIQVSSTDALWNPPNGNGGFQLPSGDFNSTLWWSNDKAYWFWGTHYWKFRYFDGGSAAGQGDTDGGWMPGINNMDAFWLMSTEWSYATVGNQVWRYDNVRDTGDTSVNYPRSIADEFGLDFPASMDDADVHPERQDWALFKGNQIFMYNFVSKTMLPGYPRAIHQDSIDGGNNGLMRNRCSGVMDLSTMIGFVEDKSPDPSLRMQNYDANLNCEWSIVVPSLILRAYGFNGYRWVVDRFDLGAGATLEIAEMQDKPAEADIAKADWNWSQYGLYTAEYTATGAENAVVPKNNTTPTILATYTSVAPPTLNTLSTVASSANSMTLRVRFTTPANAAANPGTGFALRFAVASSTTTTYTRHNGVVWFSSLGVASDKKQTAIVQPQSQTPASISFSCRVNIYPYDSSLFNQVTLTATDATGATVQTCTGASLFTRGMVAPRCKFTTTGAQYPVTLTMNTGAFATNVMCEYVTTSVCNTDPHYPQILTGLTGTIEDGSGDKDYYKIYSNCHWLVQPPASSGALFVTYKFSMLDLAVVSFFGDSVLPPAVVKTDYIGLGTVTIYDGTNRTDRLISSLTYTDTDTTKTYASTGPVMRLSFESSIDIGRGWSGSYKVHFPPVISTITMQQFTLSSSAAISAQLTALKSAAQSIVRAGSKQSVTLFGTNKAQEPISWQFPSYQAYYRWIPTNIDSAAASALALYPQPLSTTNLAFWSGKFASITQAQLDSVVEIASVGASLAFTAPTITGDYYARLAISIYTKDVNLAAADGWGNRNPYLSNYYSVIASDAIVHVAPDVVTHDTSSSFVPDASFNFTNQSQDWTNHYDALKQMAIAASPAPSKSAKSLSKAATAAAPTLSVPVEAGTVFSYIVVARDQYGNIREGFEKDDLRGYLGSELALSSPNVRMQILAPGLYYFSARPTVAADDYLLTVLVGGVDIQGGPFYPVVLPSVTDAAFCTAVIESTGQSVLTTSLPAGQNELIIRVTAYDRFKNVQLPSVAAANDTVILAWPNHNVQFLSQNGSSWLYTVSTPVEFGTSVMTLRVNNAPLGFDPSQSGTMGLASGITVSTGIPRVIDQPTPVGLQGSLTAIAALLMVLTVTIMVIVHRFRAIPIIRASSPKFLQVMLVGALLLYASVIAMAIPTPNDASCALVPLLAHLGFFAIFGSLFVKTQRVRTIFTATKLQVQVLPDSRLMAQLGIMSLVYLIYYAIWMGVARPKPVELAFDLTGYVVCASEYEVFPAIPLVVEGLITVYGAYLAARIWSIPSLFNESKFLLASIYNVAVIGGLLLILVKLIITSPQVQLGFSAFGVLFVTTVVLVLMFVSKLYSVLTSSGATLDAEGDKTAFGTKTAGETHGSAMSGGDTGTPTGTKAVRVNTGAQVQAVSDDMNPNSHKTSSSTRGTPLSPIRALSTNSPSAAKYAMNARGPASPTANRAPLQSRVAPSSPTNEDAATPVVVHPDSSPVSATQETQYPQKTADELVTSGAPTSHTSADGAMELALIAQPQLPGEVDSAESGVPTASDEAPAPITTQ